MAGAYKYRPQYVQTQLGATPPFKKDRPKKKIAKQKKDSK